MRLTTFHEIKLLLSEDEYIQFEYISLGEFPHKELSDQVIFCDIIDEHNNEAWLSGEEAKDFVNEHFCVGMRQIVLSICI